MNNTKSESDRLIEYLGQLGVASLLKVLERIRSMTGYGEIRIEIRDNKIYRISVTQSIKPSIDLGSTDV